MTGMHIDVETYHSYPLEVAGLKRDLPICRVSDSLYIAAFVIFGDVELTKACASELIKKLPPYDVLITAEAKGIPLVYEMARQLGDERYLIARKAVKLYMKEPHSVEVHSITTAKKQTLFIDKADADYMRGKRVVIVDDVISTGESLFAVENWRRRMRMFKESGGTVAARMAILAEGDAKYRDDILYLEELPLFHPKAE